jgi:regulator of sigma E protease
MMSIVYFIIVLGIIVFFHELGHFLAAKLTGVRVEIFSLGYPPKMFSRKFGDTEYMLSWIPLGGYVKMAGMIDESMDDKPLTGASWEFMSKNFLQKVFIISAGVIMNLILAFLIYTSVTLFSGIGELGPAKIGSVEPGYPADSVGIKQGDLIVSIDGDSIAGWEEMADAIHAKPNQVIQIGWLRDGKPMSASAHTIAKEMDDETGKKVVVGLMGVGPKLEYRPAGFFESIELGGKSTGYIIAISAISLKMLVTGEASIKDLVGPVGIVHYSGETAKSGAAVFFSFIALISINIGFINLLPFPALDGGHIVYIIIEPIIRRPISTKVKLIIQQAGMALLLLLILFISYNDIMRFFVK